jgi:hypothetical protein
VQVRPPPPYPPQGLPPPTLSIPEIVPIINGGAQNGQLRKPIPTLYLKNLNEKIKPEGKSPSNL